MERDWRQAGVELTLQEVMAEPIVHLVMRRDGLTPEDVWAVVGEVTRRQAAALASPATSLTVGKENQNAPKCDV